MSNISPPAWTLNILKILEDAGFEAYLVGGCVRDTLLGRRPQDWDVCTDAKPDKILSIFPNSKPTGLKHGTVTVIASGRHAEVTTFRADAAYADHRRPDSVRFVSDLREDLARRDFTVNAMAMSCEGEIIDLFGGRVDLANKLIRCVGDAYTRFDEDALRMFRALRFCAQLGFSLDTETEASLRRKAHLAIHLAPERIRDELEKMLLSPNPALIFDIFGFGLMDNYTSHKNTTPNLSGLSRLPKDRVLRWAGLCAVLAKGDVIKDAEIFLTALRLDGRTIKSCACGVNLALAGFPTDSIGIKRLLAKHGEDAVRCAAAASDTLAVGRRMRDLKVVLESEDCWSLDRLAVTGDDLLELGLKGKALGDALGFLLDRAIEEPELNERERLLGLLEVR